MKSGIAIEEIEKGEGQEAQKNDYVLVECLFFLNQGEQVEVFPNYNNNQYVIYLKSRSFIPGLLHGINGMHEGGTRNIKISPHLAFGERGILNKIPPNALLICKVKLFKIVDESFSLPSQFNRSRQVVISHRGEALNRKHRWTFGIINDGKYGLTVNHPIPGMTWRHTRNRRTEGTLVKDGMENIFIELRDFPNLYSSEIVEYKNVWADMSEKAGNTPRERKSNILCLNVVLHENEKLISSYYVTENNKVFANLSLCKHIAELLSKDEMK
ncbi:MAG: FKBP-type peptidyl-prolyl cis-trans isomerase [Deltaproteobacteria bacterium]|nr:FKBP-type peptidyl-prolyl cis-trans isomerase [Deltaproteobacteria bacterium]